MPNPRRRTHGRGVSWEITYRADGRQIRQRFPTKAAALDALATARVEIRRGTHLAPVESKTTLASYIDRWALGLQVARSTREHYDLLVRCHIVPALGHRPLNTLRRTDITAFVALLVDKGLAPSTVESIYNLLAMICALRSTTGCWRSAPAFG